MRMALRTSISLGDYRTQAKTLQLLILMSANPVKEFEELGNLQHLSQGDNYNLTETLAAKYVVSNDDTSKQKLRDEIASQWSNPGFSNGLSAYQLWILAKIRYALARDDTEADRALREADAWFEASPSKFVEYVNRKMPTQRDVRRGSKEARHIKLEPTEMRSNKRNTIFNPISEPGQQSTPGWYGKQVIENSRAEASVGERELTRESRSHGRTVTNIVITDSRSKRNSKRNAKDLSRQDSYRQVTSYPQHSRLVSTYRDSRGLNMGYETLPDARNIARGREDYMLNVCDTY